METLNLGQVGEEYVAQQYRSRGFKIVGRNINLTAYKQLGEIDIVALKNKNLVFIEVKTRTSHEFMDPEESVGFRTQSRLLKAVKAYLNMYPKYSNFNAQIDVAIVVAGLDGKIKNATLLSDVIQDS